MTDIASTKLNLFRTFEAPEICPRTEQNPSMSRMVSEQNFE